MKNKKTAKLVLSAMFATFIAGLTLFPKISIPGGGYIHLGDTMVFISAVFIPTAYAVSSATIGGCLADLFSGYAVYAPFTVLTKSFLAVIFTDKTKKIFSKHNIFASLASIIITPVMYFLADCILYGMGAAVSGIIWNTAQSVASMMTFFAAATALDKLGLKNKLFTKLF